MLSIYNLWQALLIGCMVVTATIAQPRVAEQTSYPRVAPHENERCAICDMPLSQDDAVFLVRGRRVPLKQAMVDSFMNNQERFFAKMQPRSALFQENLQAPKGTAQGGVAGGWFALGVFVVLALLCGGASAYLAVCKGLSAAPYFAAGFFLNVIGVLLVLVRGSQAENARQRGLRKIARTAAPVLCPNCGASNHPAAANCSGCGEELVPAVQPETARI